MNVVAVLSHLMSQQGDLGEETLARVECAIDVAKKHSCQYLLTSGWAYREDSSLQIGQVVADFIHQQHALPNCTVIADTHARDTVGDAFFLKQRLSEMPISTLFVVSSDYHVARTRVIFEAFFAPIKIEVLGASTQANADSAIQQHELASIDAFYQTFEGVDFADDEAVFTALTKNHPFYNGMVYPLLKKA